MILIYSKGIDDFVNEVIDCLNTDFIRIGGENDLLSFEEFSQNKAETILTISSNNFSFTNLNAITCKWFNGGFLSINGSSYENSCFSMILNSFLNNSKFKKIGRLRSEFEVNKVDASLEAKRQGLKVPDTLLTSKKDRLIAFYDKYYSKDGIICKRITDQYFFETDAFKYDFNLTFEIDTQILRLIPDEFAISLFQEKIISSYEIRVVYLLGKFYAMSIHTFDSDVDYRTKLHSKKNIRMIPFNLPEEIQVKLKKVFINLNLNYGSADLMYKSGDFYFLEINPTGQVSFLNNACNYYLENKLAEHLIHET